MSATAWSKILGELHVREYDLRQLQYLYAIHREKAVQKNLDIAERSYEPFSAFDHKSKYAGFYLSRWYIDNVYMDYMQHIHPILDQWMSLLTAFIIKWDHSFKAFVPTKTLSHIHAALEGMVQLLTAHGLPQPVLGFTDNISSDAATFMHYVPSLAWGTCQEYFIGCHPLQIALKSIVSKRSMIQGSKTISATVLSQKCAGRPGAAVLMPGTEYAWSREVLSAVHFKHGSNGSTFRANGHDLGPGHIGGRAFGADAGLIMGLRGIPEYSEAQQDYAGLDFMSS
ncbi:hypothetical protein B0H17DRAFT_1149841 [Mycena rosella]|uniref:Uncharacterized protein n=1 Tax=Mycena rosella TaxID=1033263 RepID=A0AAD7BY41_MYCRO|nr:hypothetical protein B0H17DRAFT_1149841 [Mycena rosella]